MVGFAGRKTTAAPAVGYAFNNWSGSVTSTNNPLALLLNSNRTLSANFYVVSTRLAVYQPQSAQSILTNGFRLLLTGPTNVSYAVERSINFTSWTAFQTSLVTSIPFEFKDSTASNAPLRFYRARRLP